MRAIFTPTYKEKRDRVSYPDTDKAHLVEANPTGAGSFVEIDVTVQVRSWGNW